jgi:SAM-dependent methyltransferase
MTLSWPEIGRSSGRSSRRLKEFAPTPKRTEGETLSDQLTARWNYLYQCRKTVRAQFPDFWKLRIVKKPLEVIGKELKPGARILDIGAGDRKIGQRIGAAVGAHYKSMDVDRGTTQDYYSLDDIAEQFDAAFLFEVIEHLDVEKGVELLRRIHSLLAAEGKIFLTTPNVYHPHRYWGDCFHKTPYRYDELGGLLLATGYHPTRMYRIYNDALLRRIFRIYCAAALHRYLNIDFALSILIVAQRKD